MVYVLTKDNKPLMPTNRHGHVRRLLKAGKAKVVRRMPFTIKLLYETPENVQELTLGVDTGSSVIGNAVSTNDGKIVYTSKIIIRNDIKKKMDRRRTYRRNRRNRKTRYRKARFNYRRNSIRSDRFSPTMISKYHSHIKEIEFIKSILPITKLVLETGTFDPHLLKDPSLANPKIAKWGYQKGTNYGFENTKAMVLNRDGYKCHICKTKKQGVKLEVHHIIFRSNGGGDSPENLITLCHNCHEKLHHGEIKLKLKGEPKGQLKHATQMNSIRIQLLKYYPEAIETFGYITKANRQNLNIAKDHHLDACVIASEGRTITNLNELVYIKRDIPRGDMQQTKGVRSKLRIETGKIHGFRKFDKVRYFGREYFIKGRMSSGYAVLMDIYGKKVDFSHLGNGNRTPKLTLCKRISSRRNRLICVEKI